MVLAALDRSALHRLSSVYPVLKGRPHTLVSAPKAAEPPWWREHLWKLITTAVIAIISIVAKLLAG